MTFPYGKGSVSSDRPTVLVHACHFDNDESIAPDCPCCHLDQTTRVWWCAFPTTMRKLGRKTVLVAPGWCPLRESPWTFELMEQA